MKKLLTQLACGRKSPLALLTILLAFASSVAWGAVDDTFQRSDLKLKFKVLTETEDDKTVSVTGVTTSILGHVVIPDAVEYNGATYLVTNIGGGAFRDKRLTKITLGANVCIIGYSAFKGCYLLEEVVLNDGLQEIGNYAFEGCTELTAISVPSTVNNLGFYTFKGCTTLKTVTIAEGTQLKDVNYDVFTGTAIETLTLPEGIEFVSGNAFDNSSLTTLNLPSTFNIIKSNFDYSFMRECPALKAINIASSNPIYKSIDGIIYSKDGETLFFCPNGKTGIVAIADGTKTVTYSAFSGCGQITQLDIPEGVTDFSVLGTSLDMLQTINIPSTLTNDLGWCKQPALTTIHVAEDNPALCSIDGVLYSKDKTTLVKYPAGRAETEYVLPDDLLKIGDYAFAYTTHLQTLNTNSSLDSIAAHAFYQSGITQATLNAPLRYIGEEAFSESTNLTTLRLPASLKRIASNAFLSCTKLADITFGTYDFTMDYMPFAKTAWFDKQMTESEDGCIYSGTTLIAYVNEDQDTPVDIVVREGTTHIGNAAFFDFSNDPRDSFNSRHPNIKSIKLPSSLKYIGHSAMRNLYGITSLTIPDAVEEIGDNAIIYMTDLETLHIGKGLKKYGGKYKKSLFEGCRRLANVTVDPANTFLKAIDNMLVRNNDTLTFVPYPIDDVVVPDGIKAVEDDAFLWYQNQMQLRTLTIGKDVESLPAGMMFKQYIVAEDNPYYKVEDQMLLRSDSLLVAIANQETENLVIPASVKRIGARVMNWNGTLKTLKLADCTEVVGEAAFEGCMNLESVDMGKSLTTLEDYAFYDCDKLQELQMPATFRKMYGKSFLGDIKRVTFTAVGEIEYDPSISYNPETTVTVSFPCVSTVNIVSDDPNFDPNRIALNPYPGIYSNGQMTQQDTYDETTMTGNELYFTTVDDAGGHTNYIVVANNSGTPSGGTSSEDKACAPAASSISAHCANLKIKDGVTFSTPIAFTADVASVERSLTNNWSTIALPFAAQVPSGCQVAELLPENKVTVSSNSINFTTVTGNMQAGKGYLIKAADGATANISTTNATIEPSVAPEADAQFIGNTQGAVTFDDAFRSQPENVGYVFYGFSSSQNQFVRLTDTATCGTYCAYLKLDSSISAPHLPLAIQTTGIDSITLGTPAPKGIYTLDGVRLSAPRKGINIINGKKVMVK